MRIFLSIPLWLSLMARPARMVAPAAISICTYVLKECLSLPPPAPVARCGLEWDLLPFALFPWPVQAWCKGLGLRTWGEKLHVSRPFIPLKHPNLPQDPTS